MPVVLKNNAFGFLHSAISNSDTTAVLTTGTGANFPTLSSGEYFYATISPIAGASEIVKVTARSGDLLTIVRAQEGTSALSFPAGSRVELRVTARSVLDAIDDKVATKDQASEIAFTPVGGISSTNVQAALAEVLDVIDDKVATKDQASEIAFTPVGGISSTNVQAALAELDTEKTTLANVLARLDDSGAALVGYQPAGTGAVARTVQDKLREVVSVKDFGAVGDGVTDDTAAIQAALNSGARWVSLPTGTFLAGPVILPSGVGLVGNGGILKAKAGSYYQVYIPNGSVNSTVDNVTFDAAGLITAGSPTGETACISSATTSGTMSGLRLTNNRFLNIPTTLGQRIHAIQLNYGEAYVAGNYTPQCGGDIYNFNNGYFIVEANIAKNSGDGGIAFNNNARGCIVGNFIWKCDLGVGAGPEGTDANPDHTLLISSNEIVACGDGINMGWFGYGGRKAPRNAKVVGNTLAKCKRSGIRYDGSDGSWPGYVTIIGNTIHDCGSTDYDGTAGAGLGIFIGACKYTLISGNILHDNAGTDIVVNASGNVEVIGNALNAGVYAESGGSWAEFSCPYGLIANNTAYGRRLLIKNAIGVRVLGNTLTLGLTTTDQGAVVVATSAIETTISENNFVDCGVAVRLPNLAGWFANDVLDSNKFFNCTNKVVNSPLPREGDKYVECMFLGTADATGGFSVAHGTANNGGYVVSASAFLRGNSGESIPMTLAYVDGGVARFTSSTGYAGRACRAWIRYNKDAGTW